MNWNSIYGKLGLSRKKYSFYEGSYSYSDPVRGKVAGKIPPSKLGWGKRAVEMRANKTHFDRFENDTLGLNDIMVKYGVNSAFEKIKTDVLVCGVGFLAFSGDRVVPFTAEEATGTYDWYRQNLKNGIAVFRESTSNNGLSKTAPDSWIRYDQDRTIIYSESAAEGEMLDNPTGRPLMGLLTHNATTRQPFGHTVLSAAARSAIIDGSRAVRQAMVAAYHYNMKVDVILGADNETPVDTVEGQAGDILKIGPNENGQIPQIGELAQHAMAPFTDTVMLAARNFCSDTDLNLANLGISTDAPQSTEALEIVGDDLKDDIMEWQRELGEQLKYFAVTLYMYENNLKELDENLQEKVDAIAPVWMPIYRADVSKFGDGLTKVAQQAPEIVKARSVWRNLGLSSEEIDMIISSASTNS